MSKYAFKQLTGSQQPFDVVGQGAITALESIMPHDKAQAVPFVQIWKVDVNTGRPVNAFEDGTPKRPLTVITTSPPTFGGSVDETTEMLERPDVSLESISIKTNNPIGLINWRSIDINLVVHKPEVVFQKPVANEDAWYSLITPGVVHALQWGWQADENSVSNGILNGNGIDGEYEIDAKTTRPWKVAGKKTIRFTVVNYQFHLSADKQIRLSINALEDGEFSVRKTWIVPGIHPKTNPDGSVSTNDQDAQFNAGLKKLVNQFKKRLHDPAIASFTKGVGKVIRIEDLCNVLFAEQLGKAIENIGQKGKIDLYMGRCNKRVPVPMPQHQWKRKGGGAVDAKDVGFIGDFTIPIKWVEEKMIELLRNGQQLTLYNFITPFLAKFQDHASWKHTDDPMKVVQPDVQMKFQTRTYRDPNTSKEITDVIVYIADVKSELVRLMPDAEKQGHEKTAHDLAGATRVYNRNEVAKAVESKGIPYVDFMKGNSWIQDASFEVIQDPQIKSILIERYMKPGRGDVVGTSDAKTVTDTMDYRESLYNSAIKGTLTCIGNHAFDIWGLYWIDFGVPKWNGPFRVSETTETISAGGWTKTLNLIAEGSDPLGTQGRPKPVPKPAKKKAGPQKKNESPKKYKVWDQGINRTNPWPTNGEVTARFIIYQSGQEFYLRIPEYVARSEEEANALAEKLSR